MEKRYWVGRVSERDDFGNPIKDQFIDGVMRGRGSWAIMTPAAFRVFGVGKLGTGYGQRYKKQADGKWLKVEG